MKTFPAALNVDGRPCLVIGSNGEAFDKTIRLVSAGARVTLIAPELLMDRLDVLTTLGVKVEAREFRESDLSGQFFVVLAIKDDRALAERVFSICREQKILLCAIDQPDYCDVSNVSVFERGPLRITISTEGVSPALAKKIREGLESSLKETPIESRLESLRLLREQLSREEPDAKERQKKLIDAVKNVSFKGSLEWDE